MLENLQIQVPQGVVMKYQTLPDSIKTHVERNDVKGNDTFDISDWWKTNCVKLPVFTYVLRTFDTDQKTSYDDYM